MGKQDATTAAPDVGTRVASRRCEFQGSAIRLYIGTMLASHGNFASALDPPPFRPPSPTARLARSATAFLIIQCVASTLCGCAHTQPAHYAEIRQPAPPLLGMVRPAQETQRPPQQVAEQRPKPPRQALSTADKETLFQEFLTWERMRRQKTTVTALGLHHAETGEEARRGAPGAPSDGSADNGRSEAPPVAPADPAAGRTFSRP
jgi:hypothetical protein